LPKSSRKMAKPKVATRKKVELRFSERKGLVVENDVEE
jgi:hypothetical protein